MGYTGSFSVLLAAILKNVLALKATVKSAPETKNATVIWMM
jgi:hypothetical protein